ncbi:MAG: 30S ribosomal protein S19e [Nitrososphaeria archaeon]
MRRRDIVRALALDALYRSAAYGGDAGELLARYAGRLLEKGNVRKPYEYRLVYCRKCKGYSPIGVSRSVRLRNGNLVFRCSLCGATYRVPYGGEKARRARGRCRCGRSDGQSRAPRPSFAAQRLLCPLGEPAAGLPTAYDIPPDRLLPKLADYLKQQFPEIKPPDWATYAKTSSGRERPPAEREWWYARCASVLRKIYLHGPVSVKDLRSEYGGRKKKLVAPPHHVESGSSIIRHAIHQLEAAGLVEKTPRGRVVTSKGRSVVDAVSTEIFREIIKEDPELARITGAGGVELGSA